MADTGFDRFFKKQMGNPAFRAEYERARAEIDATDQLVRDLDAAREQAGMGKSELARKIAARPEVVRRLFTAENPNPTIDTIVKVATALGYHLELVQNLPPRRGRKAVSRPRAARRARG